VQEKPSSDQIHVLNRGALFYLTQCSTFYLNILWHTVHEKFAYTQKHNVKDTPQAIKGQYSLNIIQPPLAQQQHNNDRLTAFDPGQPG